MCGASQQQKQVGDDQAAFYRQLTAQDATTFGEDQGILKQVQSVYAPILAAGPNQFGFSKAQTDNLNTSATEGVASSYAGAGKALHENQAAQGGGDTYLSSGVSAQQDEALAEGGAQQESTDKLGIQQAGYQQGYNQFQQATSALEGAASQNNSTEYAGAANGAGSAASTTQNEITQANSSWYAPLVGAAASVATGGLSAAVKNMGGKG